LTSETILLVEDNEDDVFAFKWALRKALVSKPIQVVTDGRRAITYLGGDNEFADREQYPVPSMVFLDLKLPYVSGHEVLEWIRKQPQYRELPVVILSGSDEDRDHKRAHENGANGYLVKPVSPETLSRVITSFCGN
jgi:CheY-like chemotaxis protein